MLEQLDLEQTIDKAAYQARLASLEARAAALQRRVVELAIPVVVVFEGWIAAGKGTAINRLMTTLDPRGFTVHSVRHFTPPAQADGRPFLWRFWTRLPAKGRFAIFDRSWYGRVLGDRVDQTVPADVWQKAYEQLNFFEAQLVTDGTLIVKFFLHISAKEQARRYRKLRRNPATGWRIGKRAKLHHQHYEPYALAVEDMLVRTDTGHAPWTLVAAHDRRVTLLKVLAALVDAVERHVGDDATVRSSAATVVPEPANVAPTTTSPLARVDLSQGMSRKVYETQLGQYQRRIRDLEYECFRRRLPVIVGYEGWDAAGKGGNIRRLTQNMDPRGYRVTPISAPSELEKSYHYLWRFWRRLPAAGQISIFDRTWYGRVLVERVEGLCSPAECQRAYREINEMEKQWTSHGIVLVKFWIHIDKDEQLRRFEERQRVAHKQWKLTADDWRNRDKWDAYKEAADEMLLRTSTGYAPWTILEANSKYYARVKALKTVITAVEHQL